MCVCVSECEYEPDNLGKFCTNLYHKAYKCGETLCKIAPSIEP